MSLATIERLRDLHRWHATRERQEHAKAERANVARWEGNNLRHVEESKARLAVNFHHKAQETLLEAIAILVRITEENASLKAVEGQIDDVTGMPLYRSSLVIERKEKTI